jgi:hypothetical protein
MKRNPLAEKDLEESEWRRQRARQVPPCPQAAPEQLTWACEVVELPEGELWKILGSSEPGALSRRIKEAWQALLVFLPDKRMGVHAPWAAHLGHAMEILRQWAAYAEAAVMLIAHGAHPDDAAQQAVQHQIQQHDLQQTQLAIEEIIAAVQISQAKQEALELEFEDKIRDASKKLVTCALDQGLEPKKWACPAKKRRGEQLQDASGAMVTSNGRGGTYQIGGAVSSNASAPTAEGTAPLPDATPATAPGAAPDAVPAEPTEWALGDLEVCPGPWAQSCPMCGSAIRWEIFRATVKRPD